MSMLILLRHGESQWNLENRFTGWEDVSLTSKGIEEAKEAGKIIKKHNIKINLIFSSILSRAYETAKIVISEINIKNSYDHELNIIKNKALNERNYGKLVGLNKKETAKKYGEKQVHIWRRSFDVTPPGGESLEHVLKRVEPYFKKYIQPEIKKENNILVSAHGNSLRAMMICIGLYKPIEISNIELPTGKPFAFYYKKDRLIKTEYLI